ncbi:LysE family translocator [Alteromonas gracilis]|uniref:LysE family translocator n=1 Tax=Alteromonas gracilis TaxID=1479524 RepID=UPI003735BE43
MEDYLIFLLLASITVLSPGPGVILTLTNTIRYGFKGAIGGIIGVASGTFIVAGVSATSLGVLLSTSAVLFTALKYVGATYLIYLGIKLWRSPAINIQLNNKSVKNIKKQFLEGFILQLTNPKPIFFFISVFPQFINVQADYLAQFSLLVATFSSIIIVVHICYSLVASTVRTYLTSDKGGLLVNKLGGFTFMCFGAGLATASK